MYKCTRRTMDSFINLEDCKEYATLFVKNQDYTIKLSGTADDPYFCGKDVCAILEYENAKQALFLNVDPENKKDLKKLNEMGTTAGPTPYSIIRLGKHYENLGHNDGRAVYINKRGL